MDITPFSAKNRYLYLFVVLLVFFLTYAFVETDKAPTYILDVFFSILLIASVYAIEHNKKVLVIAVIFAVFVLAAHWSASYAKPSTELFLTDIILSILFFTFLTVNVLSTVLKDKIITRSTLFGAICGYLLIGFTWSLVYALIYEFNAKAFVIPDHLNHAGFHRQYFIYYSFVTMSTLGYGDITPATQIAKTFSWLEAILGQIYLTVWIAQLVGLRIAHRKFEGLAND